MIQINQLKRKLLLHQVKMILKLIYSLMKHQLLKLQLKPNQLPIRFLILTIWKLQKNLNFPNPLAVVVGVVAAVPAVAVCGAGVVVVAGVCCGVGVVAVVIMVVAVCGWVCVPWRLAMWWWWSMWLWWP